jgi:hypothetical protein
MQHDNPFETPQEVDRFGPGQRAHVPHSRLGIASLILSFFGVAALVGTIGVGTWLEITTPGGMAEDSPQAVLLGLGMLCAVFICLVGLSLGIAGVMQPDRKKISAVLGIVISVVALAGMMWLVLIGLMLPE